MNFGLPKPTEALEHGRKPLCCIQGKLERQPLQPLGFRETSKAASLVVEARGREWKRQWAQRETKKQGTSTEGWKGFKRVIKEAMRVEDRWIVQEREKEPREAEEEE